MKISFAIETMMGMNWPIWKRVVPELESMGFAALYRSDHFPLGVPGVTDSIELITSLTYVAEHTGRMDFGSLVAPLSFHDPVVLARQAMSLNDLSGGRMILGVGAGWMEAEHTAFGYSLGDVQTRLDRLAEGLEVITRLVRDEGPVNFQGQFYKLQDARLLPRPQQPTRILVGGKGVKRTLPLVARYADLWNCGVDVVTFRDLSARLDALLLAAGRQPGDVKRSVVIPVMFLRTPQEFDRMLEFFNTVPFFAPLTAEGFRGLVASMGGLIGAPEQVVELMQDYAHAGADEFVVQWFNPLDWTCLDVLAKDVLPHFI